MSAAVDAELAQEDVPARGDRGLRELELADVALGEVDGIGGVVAAPREHEHSLLADLHEPRRQAGVDLGRLLVGHEAAGVVEKAGGNELRDRVHETRPAHADGRRIADHLEVEVVAHDLDALDRPLGRPHPAADLGRLERRAGRSGGRDDALVRPERDLGVRSDVDEEPQAAVAGEARREHPGDDVAAHVRPERREDERRRERVDADAEVERGDRRSRRAVTMNGATASGSGSMPSAIWVIVTLPHTTIS